jgi:hypothetical protein
MKLELRNNQEEAKMRLRIQETEDRMNLLRLEKEIKMAEADIADRDSCCDAGSNRGDTASKHGEILDRFLQDTSAFQTNPGACNYGTFGGEELTSDYCDGLNLSADICVQKKPISVPLICESKEIENILSPVACLMPATDSGLNVSAPSFQPTSIVKESQTSHMDLITTVANQLCLSRLPPPEPPVFSGDPLLYSGWLAAFRTLIKEYPRSRGCIICAVTSPVPPRKLLRDISYSRMTQHLMMPRPFCRNALETHL